MFGLIRLAVFGFLILSVIYLIIVSYSRWTRRMDLTKEWEAAGKPGTKRDYIAKGIEKYEDTWRYKASYLVFIVPICIVMLTIYLVNFH